MYSYLENYIPFWMRRSEKTKGLLTLLTFIFIIRFWPQFSLLKAVLKQYSTVQRNCCHPFRWEFLTKGSVLQCFAVFWSTEVKANDMLSPVFIVVKVWAQRLSNKSRQISNFTSAYVQIFVLSLHTIVLW